MPVVVEMSCPVLWKNCVKEMNSLFKSTVRARLFRVCNTYPVVSPWSSATSPSVPVLSSPVKSIAEPTSDVPVTVSSSPVPVASSPVPAESIPVPVCASFVHDRPRQSLPVPAKSPPVSASSFPVPVSSLPVCQSRPRRSCLCLPVPAVFVPVFAVVAVPFWFACPVFCLVPIVFLPVVVCASLSF